MSSTTNCSLSIWFILPLERQCDILNRLSDRFGILRCVCSSWKQVIDDLLTKSTKNALSVIYESTSLSEWVKQTPNFSLIFQKINQNAVFKAIRNGTFHKDFVSVVCKGMPINLGILCVKLTKMDRIDLLDTLFFELCPNLSSDWFFPWFENDYHYIVNVVVGKRSDKVFQWFQKNLSRLPYSLETLKPTETPFLTFEKCLRESVKLHDNTLFVEYRFLDRFIQHFPQFLADETITFDFTLNLKQMIEFKKKYSPLFTKAKINFRFSPLDTTCPVWLNLSKVDPSLSLGFLKQEIEQCEEFAKLYQQNLTRVVMYHLFRWCDTYCRFDLVSHLNEIYKFENSVVPMSIPVTENYAFLALTKIPALKDSVTARITYNQQVDLLLKFKDEIQCDLVFCILVQKKPKQDFSESLVSTLITLICESIRWNESFNQFVGVHINLFDFNNKEFDCFHFLSLLKCVDALLRPKISNDFVRLCCDGHFGDLAENSKSRAVLQKLINLFPSFADPNSPIGVPFDTPQHVKNFLEILPNKKLTFNGFTVDSHSSQTMVELYQVLYPGILPAQDLELLKHIKDIGDIDQLMEEKSPIKLNSFLKAQIVFHHIFSFNRLDLVPYYLRNFILQSFRPAHLPLTKDQIVHHITVCLLCVCTTSLQYSVHLSCSLVDLFEHFHYYIKVFYTHINSMNVAVTNETPEVFQGFIRVDKWRQIFTSEQQKYIDSHSVVYNKNNNNTTTKSKTNKNDFDLNITLNLLQ